MCGNRNRGDAEILILVDFALTSGVLRLCFQTIRLAQWLIPVTPEVLGALPPVVLLSGLASPLGPDLESRSTMTADELTFVETDGNADCDTFAGLCKVAAEHARAVAEADGKPQKETDEPPPFVPPPRAPVEDSGDVPDCPRIP